MRLYLSLELLLFFIIMAFILGLVIMALSYELYYYFKKRRRIQPIQTIYNVDNPLNII